MTRFLLFAAFTQVLGLAQVRVAPPTCPGTAPAIYAYVSNDTATPLVPSCVTLGPGLTIVNGVLVASIPAVQPSTTILRTERYSLAPFNDTATLPAVGTKTITLTLRKPPVPGGTILAFTTGVAFTGIDTVVPTDVQSLQVVVDVNAIRNPGAVVVVVYWAKE